MFQVIIQNHVSQMGHQDACLWPNLSQAAGNDRSFASRVASAARTASFMSDYLTYNGPVL